jgi:hypothetical protein
VSSPNEPGYPRPGDGPGGANGSIPGSGTDGAPLGSAAEGGSRVTDPGDIPPWQRGPAARGPKPPPRPAPESPSRPEPHRGGGSPGHSPGVDARLNRFIAGGPATPAQSQAPGTDAQPPTRNDLTRNDLTRNDAYASELPDLSGPIPRPTQRKPPAERSAAEMPSRPVPPANRVQVGSRPRGGPVRASMQIRRIDPWSALKVSLVLSVALFFVWMIAVAFLYLVLGGMGVWSKLNSNVGDLLTSNSGSGGELVSSGTIFGGAAMIGLVNIVLLTAMATIGAFIYNLTTDLVGGIEVTLADRD